MEWFSRIADKAGALGSVVSAASCPACFPALASLGAAAGLGFLSEYEGLFINTLLPLFAGVALVANALGWFAHRRWLRSLRQRSSFPRHLGSLCCIGCTCC